MQMVNDCYQIQLFFMIVCDILNVGAESSMGGVRCMPPIELDVRGPSGSSQLLHFLLLSSK